MLFFFLPINTVLSTIENLSKKMNKIFGLPLFLFIYLYGSSQWVLLQIYVEMGEAPSTLKWCSPIILSLKFLYLK
jgi:hypothetical protein